jgi:hypothetical protein
MSNRMEGRVPLHHLTCDQFVTGVNAKRVNLMIINAILLRLQTVVDVNR